MKYHMTKVGNVYVTDPARGVPSDCQPVAVVPPEDREQVERLMDGITWLFSNADVDTVQAALREFANPTPPKPEEPTGLGAVVEDVAGLKWMRTLEAPAFHPWAPVGQIGIDKSWRAYADVAAVRVLAEGVTP